MCLSLLSASLLLSVLSFKKLFLSFDYSVLILIFSNIFSLTLLVEQFKISGEFTIWRYESSKPIRLLSFNGKTLNLVNNSSWNIRLPFVFLIKICLDFAFWHKFSQLSLLSDASRKAQFQLCERIFRVLVSYILNHKIFEIVNLAKVRHWFFLSLTIKISDN